MQKTEQIVQFTYLLDREHDNTRVRLMPDGGSLAQGSIEISVSTHGRIFDIEECLKVGEEVRIYPSQRLENGHTRQ